MGEFEPAAPGITTHPASTSIPGNTATTLSVAASGTVFFDLPVLGRLGVGYGPFGTTWNVF